MSNLIFLGIYSLNVYKFIEKMTDTEVPKKKVRLRLDFLVLGRNYLERLFF